jgi:DNA-binding CsgD family transcriptional regulator
MLHCVSNLSQFADNTMIKKSNTCEINMDLRICRYGNGIKLVKPTNHTKYKRSFHPLNTHYSVRSINTFSFNTYFLNTDSTILKINEKTAETMGFDSPHEAVGKNMFDISPADNAKSIVHTDQDIVKLNQLKIVEDLVIRNDGINHSFLTVKAPWYNEEDKIIGIFGCSILLAGSSFVEALKQISELGLLTPSPILKNDFPLSYPHLTPREHDCLYYFVRGKSAKDISLLLSRSQRTIEKHLENIKNKMNVTSKSELIDKVIDHFHFSSN